MQLMLRDDLFYASRLVKLCNIIVNLCVEIGYLICYNITVHDIREKSMWQRICNLINSEYNLDYIFPFLWLKGETEETLQEYVRVLDEAGIKSFCVESRPHPDYLGDGWWQELDIILSEAEKRGMKVWIFDDDHCPSGSAADAFRAQPLDLHRQSIMKRTVLCSGAKQFNLAEYRKVPEWKPNDFEQGVFAACPPPHFDDDILFSVIAVRIGGENANDIVDLTKQLSGDTIVFNPPEEGKWNIHFCYLTRNCGGQRNYANMMSYASCKVLIDTVYEAHYARYKKYFGNVIVGFFSDEPMIGNGHLYEYGLKTSEIEDQAWSNELANALENKWGNNFYRYIPLLWEEQFSDELKAKVRYDYMDTLSRLVSQSFSLQIGEWCNRHGVQYIGHLIEDNNQDTRTGNGFAHFFRGEAGQDMSGIDDIGGQVFPQGEYEAKNRNGLFYHFVLGKLGSSAAGIDVRKNGRAMCEIFGNYGWGEGVRLEKYLLDHFLVRGINRFIPHAFSMEKFPDPDCPPHFYVHGNDPQYRHFGALMQYANRMCHLFDGKNDISVAVLYRAESEWMGTYTPPEDTVEQLARAQIDYDFIPADIFSDITYQVELGRCLKVGLRSYCVFVIPAADYITEQTVSAAKVLHEHGCTVLYLDKYPKGVYNGEIMQPFQPQNFRLIASRELVSAVRQSVRSVQCTPPCADLRCMHNISNGSVYLFVNEGKEAYRGKVRVWDTGKCYRYDAWKNNTEEITYSSEKESTVIDLTVEPLHSVVIVFGESPIPLNNPLAEADIPWNEGWQRSVCYVNRYPDFHDWEEVILPDTELPKQYPEFSGIVRYEKHVKGNRLNNIEITDAYEGVEVFVNGESLGIQVAPPFRYDLGNKLHEGENVIAIEVATTLERQVASLRSAENCTDITTPMGINGTVRVAVKMPYDTT